MTNANKTISLFFAAMLFMLGICTQEYCLLLTSQPQNAQVENSRSYFSTEKPDLLFINRHEERVIYSIKNLPGPNLKSLPNYVSCNSLSLEERILSINSWYLSYSEIVDRSLSNSDIVFPFHYFW
jgi:hypothetical protein